MSRHPVAIHVCILFQKYFCDLPTEQGKVAQSGVLEAALSQRMKQNNFY